MELSALKDRSMIIFHMFEKLVLCPFHENARRPLRSALSFSPRRLRKADVLLSGDVVSAHRSRSPNDRQTAPVFPHEPPSSDTPPRLPMSGKGRRKTKKRSRRPRHNSENAAVRTRRSFLSGLWKKCGKHMSGNGRRPFPVHHPYRRKNSVHAGTACRYSGSFQSLPIS